MDWLNFKKTSLGHIDKVVIHIYNAILLTHKIERIWVSSSEVAEPRACYTEGSQSEREKPTKYINAYFQNLEKCYWWTYLQGRNGDPDVENGLVDIGGEQESGMNEESSINIYTLSSIGWTAGEKLLCSTGSPVWPSWWPEGMGWREERESREGGDVCIIMADLHCCTAGIKTTL